MSYTKEFEEWALKESGGSFVFESQEAHFWLTAFVRLVKEEMEDIKHEFHEAKAEK